MRIAVLSDIHANLAALEAVASDLPQVDQVWVLGDIVGISASPVGFTDAQLATRYRFTVTVSVKFDDVAQKKTLWENPALSFSDEYELANPSAGQDVSAFVGNDRIAMDRLSTDFARTVVSAILEAF